MSNNNQTAGRTPLGDIRRRGLLRRRLPAAARLGGRRVRARPQREVAGPKDPAIRPNPDGPPLSGASYQPLYKKGDPLPVAIRLTDGALLIEYHPANSNEKFQILTPLAIAAVRGTKWAMDVTPAQSSTLVVAGTVAVTNRRLNQFVVLTEGRGVDITPTDTSVVPRTWGDERVRALLSRFGE